MDAFSLAYQQHLELTKQYEASKQRIAQLEKNLSAVSRQVNQLKTENKSLETKVQDLSSSNYELNLKLQNFQSEALLEELDSVKEFLTHNAKRFNDASRRIGSLISGLNDTGDKSANKRLIAYPDQGQPQLPDQQPEPEPQLQPQVPVPNVRNIPLFRSSTLNPKNKVSAIKLIPITQKNTENKLTIQGQSTSEQETGPDPQPTASRKLPISTTNDQGSTAQGEIEVRDSAEHESDAENNETSDSSAVQAVNNDKNNQHNNKNSTGSAIDVEETVDGIKVNSSQAPNDNISNRSNILENILNDESQPLQSTQHSSQQPDEPMHEQYNEGQYPEQHQQQQHQQQHQQHQQQQQQQQQQQNQENKESDEDDPAQYRQQLQTTHHQPQDQVIQSSSSQDKEPQLAAPYSQPTTIEHEPTQSLVSSTVNEEPYPSFNASTLTNVPRDNTENIHSKESFITSINSDAQAGQAQHDKDGSLSQSSVRSPTKANGSSDEEDDGAALKRRKKNPKAKTESKDNKEKDKDNITAKLEVLALKRKYFFKVRKTTKFYKLMNNICKKLEVPVDKIRFYHQGKVVAPNLSPQKLSNDQSLDILVRIANNDYEDIEGKYEDPSSKKSL